MNVITVLSFSGITLSLVAVATSAFDSNNDAQERIEQDVIHQVTEPHQKLQHSSISPDQLSPKQ